MKKLRAWLAYSCYILVLGALFVYILFPSRAVNRYIVTRVAAVRPDVRLSIGDVSPVLPPGLKLHQVTVALSNGNALEVPFIRIYPRWLSLLGREPSVAFTALAGKGKIRGAVGLITSSADRQMRLEAELDGVRMEQLGVLQPVADYRIEGALSGKIFYRSGKQQTADVRISAADLAMTPRRPVLGIRQLRFDNVHTEATLRNRNLKLSRVILTGEQLNGELSGDVSIDRQLMDSTVSLGGTIQLNLKARESDAASRPVGSAVGGLSIAGRVPVRIQGSLRSPSVSLR